MIEATNNALIYKISSLRIVAIRSEPRKLISGCLSHRTATRIAWEDPKTIRFIQSNFSCPEQSPEILIQTWVSGEGAWNVSIIEKNLFLRAHKDLLITVAWIVIDPRSGEIQGRHYFRNIFFSEYRNLVQEKPSS